LSNTGSGVVGLFEKFLGGRDPGALVGAESHEFLEQRPDLDQSSLALCG